ncbi:hypothetical protein [Jannaschia ovalis]|uniref:Uncharacterized protein n=1 Tax=Jannaschia ovalis TaxID=3038773 RepID=A0ABY8LBN0_9RHOB|nr:hypothetical protein [Jannaschia sp. GRR-S6-38]WGH77685.1 hypothetical protein P8627_11630 [Jannaschia sp. GRR-S6-38]
MTVTGTEKKQGNATGPAPGHESLTRDDVAPKSSRARIGLIFLLVLVVTILGFAIFLADEAPETPDDAPVILNDAGDGLGN